MRVVLLVISLLFLFNGCVNSNGSVNKVGEYLNDTALIAKVKASLFDQTGLEAFDIHVNSYNGIVQLSGFVDTDIQKELAGQIARNVDGVREVVNNIIVKS